jgi:hypothetical protein
MNPTKKLGVNWGAPEGLVVPASPVGHIMLVMKRRVIMKGQDCD